MSSQHQTIVPAIMARDIIDFRNKFNLSKHLLKHSIVKRLQIDIVDQSYGYLSITPEQIYTEFINIDQDFCIDWHIMVSDIDKYLQQIKGGNLIILEYSSTIGIDRCRRYSKDIPNLGLAFDTSIEISEIENVADYAKHILILANKAGVSGQKALLVQTLDRVRLLRSIYPQIEIGWDIGINDLNIKNIFASGVNVANVTSYIFNSSDPGLSWDRLHQATL